jgi:hypothetical protein
MRREKLAGMTIHPCPSGLTNPARYRLNVAQFRTIFCFVIGCTFSIAVQAAAGTKPESERQFA